MSKIAGLVVCVVLAWGLGQRAPPAEDGPLAPLAKLVGPEWIATFPNGKLTDTQRFEWICAKKFLRNPHQVKDASGQVVYEGETIYGYDRASKSLRWWYFNATGGWIEGTITLEDDGSLLFEGQNHAPDQTPRVRSSSLLEDERWTATTWFEKDGEWQVERELEFRRKP